MSQRHQEGLAHLLYGISVGGGFIALTGEVGTGKTTLCQCLLQDLPENIDMALILNPKLNAIELLATLCDELGIAYDKHHVSLKTLVDALNQYLLDVHAKGRRTVLLIDEAQNLSMEVLEQIRLLTNLETSKTKLLQIILVGQPELKLLLARRDLRQLNQRITARYHLLPLSLAETRAYIRHRLHICNGNPDLFKNSAIKKIFKLSSGIPRVINILCDRALLGAYANNAHEITTAIVENAAKETLPPAEKNHRRLSALLAILLLSCLVFGVYYRESFRELLAAKTTALKGPAISAANTKPVAGPRMAPPPKFETPKPAEQAVIFDSWLSNPELTLTAGLSNALNIHGQTLPETGGVDCESISAKGLSCLFGKASWKELIAMKRPAILEFDLPDEGKRYALLTAVRKDKVVLHDKQDITFSLAELLSHWNGYYLIIWQSPVPDMKLIAPGQRSGDVVWLRQQLNAFDGNTALVEQPAFFDKNLVNRVKSFQRHHQLSPDGIVGAQTMIHLDNQLSSKQTPRLNFID
ncbi:MAG: AAA family ATPase [Gammaproteobacteria bacterium]